MRNKSIILIVSVFFILSSCKVSHVNSNESDDFFLTLIVKKEPGVLEALMKSCTCLQIIRVDVLHTESKFEIIPGVNQIPLPAMRVLIKISNNNSTMAMDKLAMMEDVISFELVKMKI